MPSTSSAHELARTRDSLHRAAEHLLSATVKRATGRIALLPGATGVRTPQLPDGRVVSLDGDEVVVTGAGPARRARLTTLAETAAAVGLEPGFPWTKHPPGTPYDPHAALHVDPVAATALAGWFVLGHEALTAFAAAVDVAGEGPTPPVVYPEHFDLGLTAGAVNYGFSPGDESIATPYAYVGPHSPPAPDPFWNAPFGAARTWDELTSPALALEFLRAGRALLGR
jgi:hypothetical protein